MSRTKTTPLEQSPYEEPSSLYDAIPEAPYGNLKGEYSKYGSAGKRTSPEGEQSAAKLQRQDSIYEEPSEALAREDDHTYEALTRPRRSIGDRLKEFGKSVSSLFQSSRRVAPSDDRRLSDPTGTQSLESNSGSIKSNRSYHNRPLPETPKQEKRGSIALDLLEAAEKRQMEEKRDGVSSNYLGSYGSQQSSQPIYEYDTPQNLQENPYLVPTPLTPIQLGTVNELKGKFSNPRSDANETSKISPNSSHVPNKIAASMIAQFSKEARQPHLASPPPAKRAKTNELGNSNTRKSTQLAV